MLLERSTILWDTSVISIVSRTHAKIHVPTQRLCATRFTIKLLRIGGNKVLSPTFVQSDFVRESMTRRTHCNRISLLSSVFDTSHFRVRRLTAQMLLLSSFSRFQILCTVTVLSTFFSCHYCVFFIRATSVHRI